MTNKVEYVYLLREREFINANQAVYKIGKTTQDNSKRISQYPKGTQLMLQLRCLDCTRLEKSIISTFKSLYIHRSDIGAEYFEGDVDSMADKIYELCKLDAVEAEIGSRAPPNIMSLFTDVQTFDTLPTAAGDEIILMNNNNKSYMIVGRRRLCETLTKIGRKKEIVAGYEVIVANRPRRPYIRVESVTKSMDDHVELERRILDLVKKLRECLRDYDSSNGDILIDVYDLSSPLKFSKCIVVRNLAFSNANEAAYFFRGNGDFSLWTAMYTQKHGALNIDWSVYDTTVIATDTIVGTANDMGATGSPAVIFNTVYSTEITNGIRSIMRPDNKYIDDLDCWITDDSLVTPPNDECTLMTERYDETQMPYTNIEAWTRANLDTELRIDIKDKIVAWCDSHGLQLSNKTYNKLIIVVNTASSLCPICETNHSGGLIGVTAHDVKYYCCEDEKSPQSAVVLDFSVCEDNTPMTMWTHPSVSMHKYDDCRNITDADVSTALTKFIKCSIAYIRNDGNGFYITRGIRNDATFFACISAAALEREPLRWQVSTGSNPKSKKKITTIMKTAKSMINDISYSRVAFMPQHIGPHDGIFNTFLGFQQRRRETYSIEIIKPVLDHVLRVWCSENADCAEYFWNWLAHIFQRPHIKQNTAVVLTRKKHDGCVDDTNIARLDTNDINDGAIIDFIGEKLVGLSHYKRVPKMANVFSKVNAEFESRLLTLVNETAFEKSRSDLFSELKTIIMRTEISIERKGQEKIMINDLNNYVFLSDGSLPVDHRFWTLNINDDAVYTDGFIATLTDECAEHLFTWLMERDLTEYVPHERPQSALPFVVANTGGQMSNLRTSPDKSSMPPVNQHDILPKSRESPSSHPKTSVCQPESHDLSSNWHILPCDLHSGPLLDMLSSPLIFLVKIAQSAVFDGANEISMSAEECYRHYVEWATDDGRSVVSKRSFGVEINKIFPAKSARVDGKVIKMRIMPTADLVSALVAHTQCPALFGESKSLGNWAHAMVTQPTSTNTNECRPLPPKYEMAVDMNRRAALGYYPHNNKIEPTYQVKNDRMTALEKIAAAAVSVIEAVVGMDK